jgi:hypothetical protein
VFKGNREVLRALKKKEGVSRKARVIAIML